MYKYSLYHAKSFIPFPFPSKFYYHFYVFIKGDFFFGMNSIAIVMKFRISLRHPATFIIELLFALFLMTPFVCFRWVGVCLVLVHSRCCAVTLSRHSWVSNAAIIAIGTLLNWIFHLSRRATFLMMDVEKLVIIFHAEPPVSPPLMCLCRRRVGVWKRWHSGLFHQRSYFNCYRNSAGRNFAFYILYVSISRRRRSAYKIIAALEVFTILTFEDPMNLLLLKLSWCGDKNFTSSNVEILIVSLWVLYSWNGIPL